MIRTALALALYALAMLALHTGFNAAPDMTWPVTSTEWFAANLLVLGCLAKLAGHALILFRR